MERLQIKTKGKTYIVDLHDILYCRAAGSYTEIFLTNGGIIVASVNLSNIQERMNYCARIFRVSHSILVNLQYMVCIHHGSRKLELMGSVKLSFTVTIKEIEDKLESLIRRVG